MSKAPPLTVVCVPALYPDRNPSILLNNVTDARRARVYTALRLPTVWRASPRVHGLTDSSGITLEFPEASEGVIREAAEAIATHLDAQLLVAAPPRSPDEAELERLLVPTYVPTIDKVTAHVRDALLNYPGLFKTRTDVLAQIFLVNGNGYHWDEEGCASCGLMPTGRSMNYNPLLDSARRLKKQSTDGDSALSIARRRLRLQREYVERRHRADNIDLYAALPDADGLLEVAEHFSPEWSLLGKPLPPGGLDHHWAAAAKELLSAVKTRAQIKLAALQGEAFDRLTAVVANADTALAALALMPIRKDGEAQS